MQPFTSLTGRAVSLRRGEVDTDQIIPAEYLKRVSRTGFGDGLFAAWRADPDFVLNQPYAEGAEILIAGPDFGIGSSREHAVWALLDYGFRVVISARFGDIFRNNAAQAGLLAVRLPAATVTALADAVEAGPGTAVTVDLAGREVRTAQHAGGAVLLRAPIEIDGYTRWRLMEGLDDISLTLRNSEEIAQYERSRPEWMPAAG
jgi:3-isopropylmalate/(R)-2-methylmalate dehydratase small subunit